MKVAIVHDWLVTYAGAERVLQEIAALNIRRRICLPWWIFFRRKTGG